MNLPGCRHPSMDVRLADYKAALKAHALQTLARGIKSMVAAKRLECARL